MPQGQPPSPAPLGDAKGRLILSLRASSKAFERQGQPGRGGCGQRPQIESRYAYSQKFGRSRPGKAFFVASGGEAMRHQHNLGEREMAAGDDAQTARLDQTGQRRRRSSEQATGGDEDKGAIVGDQAPAGLEGAQSQITLAGAGGSFDEDAPPSAGDAPGYEAGMENHAAGRAIWNLAPLPPSARLALRASPAIRVPARFSAQILPPCASTIWRAMAKPSPELPPNAAPSGLEV